MSYSWHFLFYFYFYVIQILLSFYFILESTFICSRAKSPLDIIFSGLKNWRVVCRQTNLKLFRYFVSYEGPHLNIIFVCLNFFSFFTFKLLSFILFTTIPEETKARLEELDGRVEPLTTGESVLRVAVHM